LFSAVADDAVVLEGVVGEGDGDIMSGEGESNAVKPEVGIVTEEEEDED